MVLLTIEFLPYNHIIKPVSHRLQVYLLPPQYAGSKIKNELSLIWKSLTVFSNIDFVGRPGHKNPLEYLDRDV